MPKLQITRGFATRDLQFGHHACGKSITPFQLYRNNTLLKGDTDASILDGARPEIIDQNYIY
jgi:hypothetical protein